MIIELVSQSVSSTRIKHYKTRKNDKFIVIKFMDGNNVSSSLTKLWLGTYFDSCCASNPVVLDYNNTRTIRDITLRRFKFSQ